MVQRLGYFAAARGVDLSSGQASGGVALVDALFTVAETALLDGLLEFGGQHSVDSVVLLYPRTVGMFDPDTAEWIVLLNKEGE